MFGIREKTFGCGRTVPMDLADKPRFMAWARARNAELRQPGQHIGPVSRTGFLILDHLLYTRHNSRSGLCFPSYDSIAEVVGCCRDTVRVQIAAMEDAGILTWDHRIARVRLPSRDGHGGWVKTWRIVRRSNAYRFNAPRSVKLPQTENPPGTLNQDFNLDIIRERPVKEDIARGIFSIPGPRNVAETEAQAFSALVLANARARGNREAVEELAGRRE